MIRKKVPDGDTTMQQGIDVRSVREAGDLGRLLEDFNYYDRNQDGLMEYGEFVRFLNALDAGMSESELLTGFTEVDTDHDGVIEFEEFLEWWGEP